MRFISVSIALVIFAFLSGCAAPAAGPSTPLFREAYLDAREKAAGEKAAAPREAPESPMAARGMIPHEVVPPVAPPREEGAPDAPLTGEGRVGLIPADAAPVQLNIERMPLYDFVNLVFGEALRVNYSVSPAVEKSPDKITLNMSEAMSAEDFYRFVRELLERYNVELQETSGMLFVDLQQRRGAQQAQSFEIYFGERLPPLPESQEVTQILSTRYLSPNEMAKALRNFLVGVKPGGLRVFTLDLPRALAIAGPAGDVRKLAGVARVLDRPYVEDKEVRLMRLEFIGAGDFVTQLTDILGGMGIPTTSEAGREGLMLLPIEPLNAVLVISPVREWLDTVRYWQGKFDNIESLGEEPRVFVYFPQNRSAEDLLNVIHDLKSGAAPAPRDAGAPPAPTPMAAARTAGAAEPGRSSSPLPATSAFGRDIRNIHLSLDQGRNALILFATPGAYKNLLGILNQLDTQPKQVLTEVTIAEVTLTDSLEHGLEWFFRNEASQYVTEIETLGGLGLGGSGFSLLLNKVGGDFITAINAFASEDLINIISTPHVVVLDGHSANINVGTDVPIVTSESSAADLEEGSVLRNVQYRNTGVQLTVSPVVNSEGILTMKISQSLSEAQINNISSIDSPLILNRSFDTILNLRSGETVLIGGLISENKSDSVNKVPLLGDIPWLGRFFRVDSKSTTKTELVVQITPYIINDTRELDLLSREVLKMEGRIP
jgi:general secretion pathway protein D